MKSNYPSSLKKDINCSVVIKLLNGDLNRFEFNAILSADQVLSKLLPSAIARDYYLRRLDDPKIVFKRHETILNHSNITLEIVPKVRVEFENFSNNKKNILNLKIFVL